MQHREVVVIVAGGSGLRMGTDIPKQFLELKGKPVLMHTLERFYHFNPRLPRFLVLPEQQFDYWQNLCEKHDFFIKHHLIPGGSTRSESVKNALRVLNHIYKRKVLVAITDGVRPFVSHQCIENCFMQARLGHSAVPVIPLKDSVREINMGNSIARNRDDYRLVQTPQVFRLSDLFTLLVKDNKTATDEATLYESTGHPVCLVDGDDHNIKITTPYDMAIAEGILKFLLEKEQEETPNAGPCVSARNSGRPGPILSNRATQLCCNHKLRRSVPRLYWHK
jgi:2-C-methyl-D-erythritol 4-phosphate cytidylyltransferase